MQGNAPVYLSQVADVIDGEKEETSLARINGERSITIDVLKAQDANPLTERLTPTRAP